MLRYVVLSAPSALFTVSREIPQEHNHQLLLKGFSCTVFLNRNSLNNNSDTQMAPRMAALLRAPATCSSFIVLLALSFCYFSTVNGTSRLVQDRRTAGGEIDNFGHFGDAR